MTEPDAPSTEAPPPEPEESAPPPAGRRSGLLLFTIVVLSLGWYLLADRYTPYTSQARVEAYVVGVAPKVAGKVTAVLVGNNERVSRGQPLFRIDDSQYAIAAEAARADLANVRQQVRAGEAAVTTARANLRAAEANRVKADKDWQRLQRLRDEDPGTVSLRRLEISEASLEAARAQVAAATSEVQRAIDTMGGLGESNTQLEAARARVAKAELDLANSTVVAETDGFVTALRTEVGQFAGTGSPVLTLIALEDLWIDAAYTENNLGRLAPGTAVEIILDVLPGRVYPGRIRGIGRGISAGRDAPAGTLPTVRSSRDWLRPAQRFPVQVAFDEPLPAAFRKHILVGGQASVIAYGEGAGPLATLGRLYIRLASLLSYAY
ncbi:HlyD family secretion protein [Pseudohaliea rubra]|uniref:Membrane fusion component of tripartite multidrug resistance system n=1 Tax=Pseudohaliea rubra DSM 19751 TaxID=1265313 RepID=A0A095VNJ9_9GAMM|nr:HlyD family secretion protein [Pseudohaliea rubra]KGE03037.1 Membrane fusion component of tripartite multidrug resistance system [Pseudohaliea rubra DSM 19751]